MAVNPTPECEGGPVRLRLQLPLLRAVALLPGFGRQREGEPGGLGNLVVYKLFMGFKVSGPQM